MNLSSVIGSLATGTYNVSRRSAGGYDANGVWLSGTVSVTPVLAICEPVSGLLLERLPEGLRTKELRAFFTVDPLKTANVSAGTEADVVEVPNVGFFQIEHVDGWNDDGFYRSVGALMQEGQAGSLPPPGTNALGDRQVDGSLTVLGNLIMQGFVELEALPLASFPADAPAGSLLWDSTNNVLRAYNGSSWAQVGLTTLAASSVTVTPSGNLASTDAQAALVELQTDIDTRATAAALTAHTGASSGAHAASAISNTPSGNLSSTEVQAALNELQTDVDTRATSAALTAHTGASSGAHAATAISGVAHNTWTNTTAQSAINALEDQVDSNTTSIAGNTTSISSVSSSLTAHTSATSAHGVSGAVVGTTDTQALSNKTFSDQITSTVASGSDAVGLVAGANIRLDKSRPSNGSKVGDDGFGTLVLTGRAGMKLVGGGSTINVSDVAFKVGTDQNNNVQLQGSSTGSATTITSNGTDAPLKILGGAADGSSAVSNIIDTTHPLTASGAKQTSLRNAGTEIVYVDKDGNLVGKSFGGTAGTSTAAQIKSTSGDLFISSPGGTDVIIVNADGSERGRFKSGSQGLSSQNGFLMASGAWAVGSDGLTTLDYTDASGTPGNATINNKPAGILAVASGASSVKITSNKIGTKSVVFALLLDNADNVAVQSAVTNPVGGDATVYLTGVTTGARKILYFILNHT